jgi:biopolymer transport protein ExbB
MTLKREKIMPPELIDAVKGALDQGDLGTALESCTSRPCPLSNILAAGFNNISEGFDVIQDSVSAAADMESEKLMQRVNYLNLLGALGPMLGLLGTVTGMVDAFASLATLSGAAKQSVLALSISQALYTTVVGLLISIPAIVGYTLLRNTTTKNLLAMETVTFDMIKVLRGAEVVEDEQG